VNRGRRNAVDTMRDPGKFLGAGCEQPTTETESSPVTKTRGVFPLEQFIE
jgi:hypothetical protein